MVADITKARRMNGGKGYSRAYITEVLLGMRRNADILAIHDEIVALRNGKKAITKKTAHEPSLSRPTR